MARGTTGWALFGLLIGSIGGCASKDAEDPPANATQCYWDSFSSKVSNECRSCADPACGQYEERACYDMRLDLDGTPLLPKQVHQCLVLHCQAECLTYPDALIGGTSVCFRAGALSCTRLLVETNEEKRNVDGACMLANGQGVEACPADNLNGCCTPENSLHTYCYYGQNAATKAQCEATDNGVWTTTP